MHNFVLVTNQIKKPLEHFCFAHLWNIGKIFECLDDIEQSLAMGYTNEV
jgi:hypothetical protein